MRKFKHGKHISAILLSFVLLFGAVACEHEPQVGDTSSRMEGTKTEVRVGGYEEMCKREPEAELCNE